MRMYCKAVSLTTIALSLALALAATATGDQKHVAAAQTGAAALPAAPGPLTLVSRLALPPGVSTDHPLYPVVKKMWSGVFGELPVWRLSLICEGLRHQPITARVTAYSSNCPDGGGSRTRWGSRVRYGICAADPRYWGPGSVIWMGAPIESMLIVEDTGSAVKGQHRFDVCFGADAAACSRFGVRRLEYIPLYRAPVTRRWSTKPAGWTPPAPPISQWLAPVQPQLPSAATVLASATSQLPQALPPADETLTPMLAAAIHAPEHQIAPATPHPWQPGLPDATAGSPADQVAGAQWLPGLPGLPGEAAQTLALVPAEPPAP